MAARGVGCYCRATRVSRFNAWLNSSTLTTRGEWAPAIVLTFSLRSFMAFARALVLEIAGGSAPERGVATWSAWKTMPSFGR